MFCDHSAQMVQSYCGSPKLRIPHILALCFRVAFPCPSTGEGLWLQSWGSKPTKSWSITFIVLDFLWLNSLNWFTQWAQEHQGWCKWDRVTLWQSRFNLSCHGAEPLNYFRLLIQQIFYTESAHFGPWCLMCDSLFNNLNQGNDIKEYSVQCTKA